MDKPLPLRALLTRKVIIAAGNYASLALVDIAFRAVQPLFLATPIEFGGFGLAPPTIGNVLSIYGIVNGTCQVFFFAQANDRFGSKAVFLGGVGSSLLLFSLFPFINHLARTQGYSPLVWGVVLFQIVASVAINFSYGQWAPLMLINVHINLCYRYTLGAIFIFIQNASPNRSSLGATNGLSQVRAIP